MPDWVTTVSALVRARAADDRPGLLFEGESWTWAEHTAEAAARAAWYDSWRRTKAGPPHIGMLLENIPEYSFWLAAAALGRFVLVGLNATRRGAELAADITSTECSLVLTDRPELLDGLDISAEVLDPRMTYPPAALPDSEAAVDDLYLLIFTSGTTGSPKAVMCSQGKIATQGLGLVQRVALGPEDITYQSMPLFHSNAVIAGWSPSLAVGATIALKRKFSASQFIPDCRAVGATYANYVGTPLSYVLAQPPSPDDRDNALVRVFGNEGAPADLERFGERFGCEVMDGFGSTEGGISISRTPDTPTGSLGRPVGDVRVLDPDTGEEKAVALFDGRRLINAEKAIGELVNLDGPFAFEGYWNAPEDTAHRTRDGRYWSGDLGYRDQDGFLYFAGRSLDRLRVGGENLTAAPIARLLTSHPGVVEAVVFAVPDAVAGDQVMAAIVPAEGFDPSGLVGWFEKQPDAATTWVPRYLRVTPDLPRTATSKVIVRQLAQQAWHGEDVWIRDGDAFRPMTEIDRFELAGAFSASGRSAP
ncbi:MAG: AMP-dependent synthetase and ligase [Frankiales bacterium]|nr:AMP-dependent synthetase and ligase [Frankiales bacterium]